MKTVAVLSQKGGSGKSTVALHLAVAAERRDIPVAVIDIDPQASAAGWADHREADSPIVVAVPHSRLPKALQTAADNGAGLVLIDTAPHSADAAIAAARVADLVIVPCRPGILDLRSIGTTADIIRLSGKPGIVVLNALPPGALRIQEDASEAVDQHGLLVCPIALHQRAAYAHALTVSLTAQEFEPEGKAAEEVAGLFSWLHGRLAL